MIKKEELRLGSLVMYKDAAGYDDMELYVDMLSEERIHLANAHGIYTGVKWESIGPSPLYYWHLEDTGFEKIQGEVYRLGDWTVDCMTGVATWQDGIKFNLKYVHQLQNLLLAVSGIELDFRNMGQ